MHATGGEDKTPRRTEGGIRGDGTRGSADHTATDTGRIGSARRVNVIGLH